MRMVYDSTQKSHWARMADLAAHLMAEITRLREENEELREEIHCIQERLDESEAD